MADLYGSNESEDMSSFLQILLHNSSSSATATGGANASAAAAGDFFNCGGAAGVLDSSSNMGLTDPSCFFVKKSDGLNSSFRVNNLNSSFEVSEGSELPVNPARSSKRTRAAEVHNLTEKRRRSRINEKLKALQKLIPNSNKTDKASMLDEAIEYLKQLQLQVQMLTLRNGLGSHPYHPLGSLQSMAVPPAGLELDERSELPTGHQDIFTQNNLQNTNQSSSTHPMVTSSVAIDTNSGILPSYIPTTQNHYELFNHIASSKDIYWDDTDSRLRLDMSCSGNDSSPGVST